MNSVARTTMAAALFVVLFFGCSTNDKTGTGPSKHALVGSWDSYVVRTAEFGDSLCAYRDRSWHFANTTWADSIFLADQPLDPCMIDSIEAKAGTWTAWDDSLLAKTAISDGTVDTFIYRLAGDTLSFRHISWAPELMLKMERR